MKIIIVILLFFISATSFAQDSLVKTEVIEAGDETRCETPYKNGKIEGIKKCIYKKYGEYAIELWSYKNGIQDGVYKYFEIQNGDTIPRIIQNFKNGYLNGISYENGLGLYPFKMYYLTDNIPCEHDSTKTCTINRWIKTFTKDSFLLSEKNYDSTGKKHGVFIERLRNGDTIEYELHSHGRLIHVKKYDIVSGENSEEHGMIIESSEFYETNGNDEHYPKRRIKYFHNGKVKSVEYYSESHEKTGTWKTYDQNGKVISKIKYKTKKNAP